MYNPVYIFLIIECMKTFIFTPDVSSHCNRGEKGSMTHYFTVCPALSSLRSKYFGPVSPHDCNFDLLAATTKEDLNNIYLFIQESLSFRDLSKH